MDIQIHRITLRQFKAFLQRRDQFTVECVLEPAMFSWFREECRAEGITIEKGLRRLVMRQYEQSRPSIKGSTHVRRTYVTRRRD